MCNRINIQIERDYNIVVEELEEDFRRKKMEEELKDSDINIISILVYTVILIVVFLIFYAIFYNP